MTKKIIVSMLFVIFVFCTNIVEAKQYKITFENLSKETVVYYLYQVDHNVTFWMVKTTSFDLYLKS
jgi:hypothetical protein